MKIIFTLKFYTQAVELITYILRRHARCWKIYRLPCTHSLEATAGHGWPKWGTKQKRTREKIYNPYNWSRNLQRGLAHCPCCVCPDHTKMAAVPQLLDPSALLRPAPIFPSNFICTLLKSAVMLLAGGMFVITSESPQNVRCHLLLLLQHFNYIYVTGLHNSCSTGWILPASWFCKSS